MTWGVPLSGGDSSRVQDQLRNVQQICSTDSAFAAILVNGNAVTWGDPDDGGDSSGVQDQPRNVQQICSTDSAFAAVLADGNDMSICQNAAKALSVLQSDVGRSPE